MWVDFNCLQVEMRQILQLVQVYFRQRMSTDVEVHPHSREKTAFIIRNGLYCDVWIDYFRIRRLLSYILTKTRKRVKLFWYHRVLLSLLFQQPLTSTNQPKSPGGKHFQVSLNTDSKNLLQRWYSRFIYWPLQGYDVFYLYA